jgi:hypothetical protein
MKADGSKRFGENLYFTGQRFSVPYKLPPRLALLICEID